MANLMSPELYESIMAEYSPEFYKELYKSIMAELDLSFYKINQLTVETEFFELTRDLNFELE